MNELGKSYRIIDVTHADVPRLEDLWREDALENHPNRPEMSELFVQGLQRSLVTFDFMESESHWIMAAEMDGKFVGYITAVRIHKADSRIAVLYVDELSALKAFRRRGIATALLAEVFSLAKKLSIWRVRLTVDPSNDAARKLYEKVGMSQRPLVLYERSS